MKKLVAISIAGLFMLNSCATIINGETQKINLQTYSGKPEKVRVDGKVYEAPGIIEVKRENKDVIISPENCPNQSVVLQKKVSLVPAVANILLFVPGLTTDYVTGSMWEYDSNVTVGCR